jgi:membrane protease YdiL (CAAX protease family)
MDDKNFPSIDAAPPTPTPAIEPARNEILYGPNGLRAGWRALLFMLIVVSIVVLINVVGHYLTRKYGHSPVNPGQIATATLAPGLIAIGELTSLAVILVASLIMGRIERRKLAHYGLPLRTPFPKYFWEGLLWGFLSISGVLFVIFLFHGFRITGVDTHGSALALSTVEWTLAFLAVGFSEEFTFRGYMQFTLTTGIGYWPAALLMSALFAFAHTGNEGESVFGLIQVAAFGILACIALQRTGNLWWPIGFHAAWDWGQTFFYGVPDSGLNASHNFLHSEFHGPKWLTGGSTGPEASIFTLICLVIVSLLMLWKYRGVRYPDPEALGLSRRQGLVETKPHINFSAI